MRHATKLHSGPTLICHLLSIIVFGAPELPWPVDARPDCVRVRVLATFMRIYGVAEQARESGNLWRLFVHSQPSASGERVFLLCFFVVRFALTAANTRPDTRGVCARCWVGAEHVWICLCGSVAPYAALSLDRKYIEIYYKYMRTCKRRKPAYINQLGFILNKQPTNMIYTMHPSRSHGVGGLVAGEMYCSSDRNW